MKRLTLREYKPEPGVPLTQEEYRALVRVATGMTITPSLEGEGRYDLTPDSHIGAIDLDTLAIEIQPKLTIERVLFLISYSLDPHRWMDSPFDFGEESSLLEAIIPGYVSHVRRALSRGVLQGYRPEEDALNTVRGRVRFDDQLRRHYGRFPPVEVRFDEFTEDIELNRIIKAAIHRLGRMRIRSDAARRSLRAFDRALAHVELVQYDRRLVPTVIYSRLNQHYRPAAELARLILRSKTIELRHGETRAVSFLVDMNVVFEDFVVAALREALTLSERTFPQNARGRSLSLDTAGRVHLEPDLSWWDGNSCSFVGDVKYKRVNVPGILHPDLYQLLAYVVAAGLSEGTLIYAAGEGTAATHEVVDLGRYLNVAVLDLAGSPDEILGQIWRLAQLIKASRDRAHGVRLVA